jgi:hypothetical protein
MTPGDLGIVRSEPRRADDPEAADFTPLRRGSSNGIDVGFGKWHLTAAGPLAIVCLIAMLSVGTSIYMSWWGFDKIGKLLEQSNRDHRAMVTAQDLTACIVSMSVLDRERTRDIRNRNDFIRLCPWLRVDLPAQ